MPAPFSKTFLRIHRADLIRRYCLPSLSIFILLLFEPLLQTVFASGAIIPSLGLCAVLHWSTVGEVRVPYGFVFFLGLLADTFYGTPLGLYAILFLLAQYTVRMLAGRLNIRHFTTQWLLVVAVVVTIELLAAFGSALLSPSGQSMPFLWLHALATLAAYPMVAWALSLISDSSL